MAANQAYELVRAGKFDEFIRAVKKGCLMNEQIVDFAINNSFYGLLRWAIERGAPFREVDSARIHCACMNYKDHALADMPDLWVECIDTDIKTFHPLVWRGGFTWNKLRKWATRQGMCIQI